MQLVSSVDDRVASTVSKSSINNQLGDRASPDIAHIQFLARLMDTAFQVPGIRIRFGLDAILGLLPGFGDFATSFVSLYILQEAHRRGVSRLTLARMGFNILIDWLIGSVPILGDAFDLYWKSNQRNVAILLEHQQNATGHKRRTVGDWLFLALIVAVLIGTLVGSLMVSYFVVSYLYRTLIAETRGAS